MINHHEKLVSSLIDIGMSDHEARVYVACLSLGSSSVLSLSKETGIKRTTVYSIIESLMRQGFIRVEIKGVKRRFIAENPEHVGNLLDIRKQKFQHILPEFSALFHLKGESSTIKHYEGLELVKTVYDRILEELKPKEYYWAISDTEEWRKEDREYFEQYLNCRSKLNIDTRLLLQDTEEARRRKGFEKNYHEHIKILPPNTSLATNLIVTPNLLVIHQFNPISAIAIENPSVVQMGRELFQLIWNSIED